PRVLFQPSCARHSRGSKARCFLLFWPEINSGGHSVFGRNPGLPPARRTRKQRRAPLFSLLCARALRNQTARPKYATSNNFCQPDNAFGPSSARFIEIALSRKTLQARNKVVRDGRQS